MARSIRTTEFLKECLSDALIRLMRENEFEKISIKAIAETAGVGRATWFRNYTGKSDALTFKLVQSWNRWADERSIAVRNRFSLKNAKNFFEFNYGIKHLLQVIYEANMQSAVYDAFYQVMAPQYGANVMECYQAKFYSYALFGLLDEWVRRGFKETPEEMIRIFFAFIDTPNEMQNSIPL